MVAELGATFPYADLEVSNEPRADHAQYLAHWLEILNSNNKAIFKAAPVVCTIGCVLGIGRVFPVNRPASYRRFTHVALFLAAWVVIVWLFSKFRGWGILFRGGIPQLLVIGLMAYVVLRRLHIRAFRGRSRSWV